MRKATDRQLKYLNALLSKALGEKERKIYLEVEYDVESSKELTIRQASDIIEKFQRDNPDRKKHIGRAIDKIADETGQQRIF